MKLGLVIQIGKHGIRRRNIHVKAKFEFKCGLKFYCTNCGEGVHFVNGIYQESCFFPLVLLKITCLLRY